MAATALTTTPELRLVELWNRTDRIFGLLAPHAWLARPIALRHPFIFYVGHLPAFAWNYLGEAAGGARARPARDAELDEVFSRGIDPDVDDPSRCHAHPDVPERWPSIAAVLGYRDRVRGRLLEAGAGARAAEMLPMVIEHELMHQETLMYMAQRLRAEDLVRPDWLPEPVLGSRPPIGGPTRVRVPGGATTLGARAGALDFGWDNEFPSHEVPVPGFALDATPVTNDEFRAFVDDGGYRRPELWRDEDWAWRERAGLAHPITWEREGAAWSCRALFDRLPLDAVGAWPVSASLAEARAYARWQGRRLPTEAEYQRAAFGDPEGAERSFPWGEAPPGARHGNFDFAQWAPMPVGSHAAGASAWGVQDLIGDGWEWTDTPFDGFPGFAPMPRYPGYSADFFDGKHAVLKGASWATGTGLIRPSFRNWFQAHYPYVFAKFRCAG